VSSESVGIPDDQPWMRFRPKISWMGVVSIVSGAAPTTSNTPLGPRPPSSGDMDFPLGAVARIALAPPSLCSSAAGSFTALSMYTSAPRVLASAAFCGPRPIAATR